MKRLLFDTQAFLWWLEKDEPRLQPATTAAILDRSNEVFISVINAWEIAIKVSAGKLRMDHGIAELAEHYGFSVLPVLLPHAAAVKDLPAHHRDPFDRMLIAQAKVEELTLITRDPNIQKYDSPILDA